MKKEELIDLQNQIEKAKTKASELKGKLEYLMADLKKNWDCETVKEAEKKIKQFDQRIAELTLKINNGSKELEAQLQ